MAEAYVNQLSLESKLPLIICEESTIEKPFGWVFFYQVDTQKSSEVIAGNGPLLVDRSTKTLHPCGSADPVEVYLENYVRSGTVNEL